MTVINWNPLVNTKFSLEGEISLKDGYVQELKFESGKEKTWLKNSFVPRVYPSLKLILDNKPSASNGKTEFEEFDNWFRKSLRYGIFPFSILRIGWKRKWYTKEDEMGIYNFIPNSIKYDKLDGIILVNFGLEEISFIPEVEHTFLMSNNEKILLTNNKKCMVIN